MHIARRRRRGLPPAYLDSLCPTRFLCVLSGRRVVPVTSAEPFRSRRHSSGQIQERAEKMRLVQGVVVGAVRLLRVLAWNGGEQDLEVLLAGLEPADPQAAHGQRLEVERLVSERVGDAELGEVVADVGPVEADVVTHEHGASDGGGAALDEIPQVAHRPVGRRPLSLQPFARDAVDRHRLRVEGAADRLQLNVEAPVLGLPRAALPVDRHRADRFEAVEAGDRTGGLDVHAEVDDVGGSGRHDLRNPGGASDGPIGSGRPSAGFCAASRMAPSTTWNATAMRVAPFDPGGRSKMRTQPSEWSSETFSEPPRRMCRRIAFWLSAPVPKMTIRPTGALVPFGRTVLNLPGGDSIPSASISVESAPTIGDTCSTTYPVCPAASPGATSPGDADRTPAARPRGRERFPDRSPGRAVGRERPGRTIARTAASVARRTARAAAHGAYFT